MNFNLRNEPALLTAVVQAVIAVAVSFGLDLSTEQVGALLALNAAVAALILRQRVSPTAVSPTAVTATAVSPTTVSPTPADQPTA
jgi:hypothetical protein